MDLLETQVSDLRSFLRQPAEPSSASGSANGAGASAEERSNSRPPPIDAGSTRSPTTASSPTGTAGRTPQVAGGKKRAAEDDDLGQKQQRTKRNRYISLACNECKRRKIKCNGETPCHRCGNLNLECLYAPNCCPNSFKDSDEYKTMADQLATLQNQVNSLFESMNALRQDTIRLVPDQSAGSAVGGRAGGGGGLSVVSNSSKRRSPSTVSTIQSSQRAPDPPSSFSSGYQNAAYRGPTSIAFTVDVAKNTLHNMGYSGDGNDGTNGNDDTFGNEDAGGVDDGNGAVGPSDPEVIVPALVSSSPSMAVSPILYLNDRRALLKQVAPDPLWRYDTEEMIRLCRVHEDEVGVMYPVVDMEDVISHARSLGTWMEMARKGGNDALAAAAAPDGPDYGDRFSNTKTLELKIIMCCALAIEEHGHSPKAAELFETVRPIIDRKLVSDPSDIVDLPMLGLAAGYRWLSNDELLAWRTIGQVARHGLELGLHRRGRLFKIPEGPARRYAINTFWVVYALDRRWSFETGLPYTLQDDKIDPKLPYPDDFPYLVALILFSKLGTKVWRLVDYFEPAVILDLKREEFEALDQEILSFYDSMPEEVKISNLAEVPLPSASSSKLQRMQFWTRLRLNQIRIYLHTPVLHSASSIQMNMPLARRAVELARETIQHLKRLNDTTDLYRRLQVFYHQFLTPAIAVLFLASTHAPVDFSPLARPEFYTALELVRGMSAKSWVSQRLWRSVRSLKKYAPRLGLQVDGEDEDAEDYEDEHGGGGGGGSSSSGGVGNGTLGQPGNQNAQRRLNRHYSHQLPEPNSFAAQPASHSVSPIGYGASSASPYPAPGPPVPAADGGLGPSMPYPSLADVSSPLTPRQPRGSGAGGGQGQGLRKVSGGPPAPADAQSESPPGEGERNGIALTNEMSRIFEGYAAAAAPVFAGLADATSTPQSSALGDSSVDGGDAGVYHHLRGML